ncbi:MAG: phosphoglucosamine mutase, partial [Clostridia bacterium]|nr:phosphoglucosamine mutase [Clostridia bacterium]
EQSGHVIFLDHGTTGDGQLTGVQLLSIVKRSGKTLSQLAGIMKRFPQVLINVKVAREQKDNYKTDEKICNVIAETENSLNGRGRVLVRASGTEPLIRVMLEGENIDEITAYAQSIADTIKTRLS